MPRTTATVTVSLPPEMAAEVERVRKAEHRTRSELVREALRHYMRAASARAARERIAALPEDEPSADEIEAIDRGRREFSARPRKRAGHGVDRRARPQRS